MSLMQPSVKCTPHPPPPPLHRLSTPHPHTQGRSTRSPDWQTYSILWFTHPNNRWPMGQQLWGLSGHLRRSARPPHPCP